MSPLTRHRAASAVGLVAVALLAGASLGACGGSGDDATADTTVDTLVGGGASTTTTAADGGLPGDGEGVVGTIDEGPFCTSIQAFQGLGAGGATSGAPEQVLAQNEAMLDLLDEATANVPEGAPADVESLFDDYRAIAVAIGGAGGDIDAAYAALQEHQPEVAARLFNASAHLPAFEYFANHCGIRFQ